MIDYGLIVTGIALTTLVPAFAALYLGSLKSIPRRYLAAVAVGLSFWYFFDTMGDAASLDASFSLYPPYEFGGLPHMLLIISFLAGVSVLAIFDFRALRKESGAATEATAHRALFLIPVAIALVMGAHSLGEGWDAASAVAYAPASSGSVIETLIQAFGNLPALVSYPIHKFLEATIIAAAYVAYGPYGEKWPGGRWWDLPLLGVLFGAPSVLGAALGYSLSFDTSYLFAFGVTAAVYAIIRLVEPMGSTFDGSKAPTAFGTKTFVALAAGFLLLYSAALLH